MIGHSSTSSDQPRTPALGNQSAELWRKTAELAYLFARHVRHDLANVHCAVQMLEIIEQIEEDGPSDTPLPPELQPNVLKQRMRTDLRRVVSISNDLILLSQCASHPAYIPPETMTVQQIIDSAIIERLGGTLPDPQQIVDNMVDESLLSMGDMLGTAISTFYFQWTPWQSEHEAASRSTMCCRDGLLEISIPADNTEDVASFARKLGGFHASVFEHIIESALSISTAELAFWLARHILIVHGGSVTVDPNDPDLTAKITLPVQ